MGAHEVTVVAKFQPSKFDVSDVDVIIFSDGGVPKDMMNSFQVVTVEWVKQCLVS